MQGVFLLAALCFRFSGSTDLCVFVCKRGSGDVEIGFLDFLLGEEWRPSNNIYGILPMIMGSIYVTAGAVVIGVPIGIFTSVFMAHYCPKKIYPFLKSATELLAGIPSVVYGFFGLVVIVPLIRTYTAKPAWEERPDDADSVHHSRNYDSSDHYRCDRVCHAECTGSVL